MQANTRRQDSQISAAGRRRMTCCATSPNQALSGLRCQELRFDFTGLQPNAMYFIAYLAWVRFYGQAPVAQLDRAPDFESGGQGFESLPARHLVKVRYGPM